MTGRTGRFAPTPSGRMHIGNVYAMLAAWLSAHAGNRGGQCGKVLLRIEDVDGPRAVKDADKWIMDDLHWLGLDWDGEPVYQSQRTEIYEEALRSLESMSLGDAESAVVLPSDNDIEFDGYVLSDRHSSLSDFPLVYPCFCSRADLRAASAPQEGDRFLIYPGTCRRLLAERPDVVRSRLEAGKRHSWRIAVPEAGVPGSVVEFDDAVFGKQRFDLSREVGDTVIRRSDGIFSYQLAVVVDDLLMGVNDIVRGRDLLRSTALQIWIRRALVASGFAAKYGIDGNVDRISSPENRCNADSDDGAIAQGSGEPAGMISAVNPAYAHLPLIDDPAGVRLAKRKHSLDIAALRADGVRPEQIIGYCAWLLGIRTTGAVHISDTSAPVAMSAREALECFTFDDIRANKSDRILSPDWADEVDRPKNGSVA
ncbi:glutamyl-Q tRNA(Asp) synthetase [Bifidobacterium sp. ESL0798]|uniref:glutamyl-Q tRNA(Asp) synthetase n=1 Tax=Bifidobacterium sp. ESL0798 TaxID=2983235 RepID=UPI0023F9DAB2|nr:glutamyl-Q tRNA(Asp) synthetase [Bifidobacterium sp. ESL0798]WEV74817.1 glutamyl-Q tRNA(Asp) synthetase [Bifidobacterium sp. ESL0798]